MSIPFELGDKDCPELWEYIIANGEYAHNIDGEWQVSNLENIQALIDGFKMPMRNLSPVQFKYLLAKNGFVPVIDTLLENVRLESVEKYARYYGFLKSASFYEYNLAYTMFDEIREKFTAIDESFNFTDDQLRAMWLEASQV